MALALPFGYSTKQDGRQSRATFQYRPTRSQRMIYATGKKFILSTPCFVSPTINQVNEYRIPRVCTSAWIFQELLHGPLENVITAHSLKETTDLGRHRLIISAHKETIDPAFRSFKLHI
jgi:hypothetical protein